MNFAPVLRNPIPERYFGSQDGLQNAPRSAQDGPKRLLESTFFALENRLKFGFVLDPILGRFWSPFWDPSSFPRRIFFALEVCLFLTCYLGHILVASKTAQEAPKRPQDLPKTAPRGPKTPPRGLRVAPRCPKSSPKRCPRGSERIPRPHKSLELAPQRPKMIPQRNHVFEIACAR